MGDIRILSEELPDLLPMTGRSKGKHVSEIITYLCVKLGHFSGDLEPNQAWMELGNAWEHAITERLHLDSPHRYIRPGEQCKDDIHGTPDLLDTHDYAVEEIKAAWMSSNNAPDSAKFWRYWVQLKAYCYMLDSSVGRLRVVFVNGDYRSPGPRYLHIEQEFSEQELQENWMMLVRHAEILYG